jgi:type III secretion protein L
VERARAALADAEKAIAERDEAIAGFPDRIDAAFAAGEAQGQASVKQRQAERLAVLKEAAERALTRFGEEMTSLERLAALLSQTCLDRMLLNDAERSRIVADLLRAQLAGLEAGATVRIQVSTEDFSSPEALAGLAPASCEIIAAPSLEPGDCTIQLRLGTLEIGVNQQWGSLRAVLEEMVA